MATPALNSLSELFVHELRDLYSAEQQLVDAIPEMAQAASHDELQNALNNHLEETRSQLQRLEDVFGEMNVDPEGNRCEAMEGMIQEGQEIIQKDGQTAVKDAALIAAAQRIEHYEISGYGTARTYAEELGYDNVANVLDNILSEEKNADQELNQIAVGGWLSEGVNVEAERETETPNR